ncbi:MAG: CoA-binding protein, partial [Clostridiaceae bacterium]|nr:CoA-binding protein [Clostridiaceae bacterium]
MNFNKLLKPKTVAVIGASEKSGFGGDTCKVIMESTEDLNRIYFVNPKWNSVFGRKCYKNIREIPTTVDLVIICTPKSTIESIIEEAATKGCGGAVVFASGYGETGLEGKKDEQALVKLCEKYNIALLGPNCAGFANYIDNVFSFAFLMEKRERRGNIGLVSQSGQICLSGLDSPAMKFSYVISCGNSSGTKIEDYINFLVEDEDTKVVAAYIEGISDTSKFVSALKKAAEKRKPLIILKAGRSYKASELASSHTGSLSGSDKAIDALFEKFGVIRVEDIQELLATAYMFSIIKELPKTDKFACVTVSGGEASVMADVGYLSGVDYIDINQDTIDKLKKIMPNYAVPNNPLDMTATVASDSDKFAAGIKALMEEETVGAVLVGWTILPEIYDTATIYLTEGIEKVAKEPWAKPIIMVPFVEHTRNKIYVDKLANVGVPILPSLFYTFKILKYLIQFSKYDY